MADPLYTRDEITAFLIDGSDDALDEVHLALTNIYTLTREQLAILATNESQRAAALRDYNARLSQIKDLSLEPGFDKQGHHVDPSGSSAVRNSVGKAFRRNVDELIERGDEPSLRELARRIDDGNVRLDNDQLRVLQQMDPELTKEVFSALQPKAREPLIHEGGYIAPPSR